MVSRRGRNGLNDAQSIGARLARAAASGIDFSWPDFCACRSRMES
jgi:hypothetical protein